MENMNKAELKSIWKKEEEAAHIHGWDFSHIKGRFEEEKDLPDYEGFDSRQLGRMTHLEPFAYPVWDIDRMAAGYGAFGAGESMGHTFVLFDYRSRSPLNHEALARPIHGGLDSATGCCTDL